MEKDPQISTENKTFLKKALVKLVPETIENDQDEQKLTELENKLKSFKIASENEEKGKIYQNSQYKKVIDELLQEIQAEKQRYAKSKEQNNPTNTEPSKGLPGWGIALIIGIVAIVTMLIIVWLTNTSSENKKDSD